MKRYLKSLLVIAATALAFASCQREGDVTGPEGRTVRFIAGPVATRTVFTTPEEGQYPVLWTENDTKVKVALNMVSGVDATVTPNGETAEFEANVNTENAEAPYTFYALSPSTAYFSISGQYMDWGVQIPSDQTPSAESPDEAAQVLAGVSPACTSLDEVIDVSFSHVTAYGRMTLTNLDLTGVAVSGVSLTAAQPLAGRFYYYVADTDEHEAGEMAVQSASNTINIATSSLRDIWFACAPADLSGTELKITVNTADGPYEKTITLPANRKFQAGRIAKFTIDMTGATLKDNKVYELVTDAAELTAGSEIIIANAAGDHALSTTQNPNNRAATSVTVEEDKIVNPSELVEILAVEAGTSAGTFAFKGKDGKYLVSENGSNRLKSSEEKTALGSFAVTVNSDGVMKVIATASERGDMRYNENNGSPIFNCYATTSTAGTAVALYKLVGSGTDEPIFQATLVGADEGGHLEVSASETTATVNVISNVDWEIYSFDDGVEFSEESGNSSAAIEVTFPANETDEEVVYTINIESDLGEFEFVITQAAFVPAGESVYRKVTSVTAGKKYIVAALVDGEVQAMTPIASGSAYGYPAGTKVSETDGVIDTRHTDLELTFTAVTGGYSIQQPDNRYWAMTGTYNSINLYDSAQESYVWTVTANNDGTVDVVNAGKNKHVVYNVNRSYFAVYETVNESNIYPSLYEYIDGGDTPPEPPVGENGWFKKDLSAITSSDVFVIVGNNGSDFAMSNDNGTSAAPAAVAVSVASDGKSLTAAPAANLQWKLTAASSSYTFYPNGDDTKWLYCTNNNNGLRVGTGDKKTFSLNSNYLYNDGQARYVGIYSEQGTAKDWRSYTSINNNIKDQTFAFFVKTAGGGEPPVVETVATPTFSPAAGEVEAGTTVTISCATSGATVHYTTDGSTPTASSTTGTSVTVNAAMTIKAIAVKEGMNDSEVASAAYTIQSTTPPSGDSYVKVSSITSGKKYIIVGGNHAEAMVPAAVTNNRLAAQAVTISGGAIASTSTTDALAVTITKSGDNYLISYNNTYLQYNGTSGTGLSTVSSASDSWVVSAPSTGTGAFRFASAAVSDRLLAYRVGNDNYASTFGGYKDTNISASGTEYFDIDLYEFGGESTPIVETVATPSFNPAAGAVSAGTVVTISCATSGATIHYTTDGSTPTASSATGTSVTVNSAMTLKAIAVKDGMNDSPVATAEYTIRTSGGSSWSQVTAVSDLKAGDQIIIVSDSKGKAASPISGTNKFLSAIDVTVSNHTIADEGTAEVFTLGKDGGNWTLTTADGKLLGAKAVKSLAYNDGTTTWTITIDSSGDATIASTTDGYGRILYNVGTPRFMNYASDTNSSMLLPQIYKN